jgi:hypothetical protein
MATQEITVPQMSLSTSTLHRLPTIKQGLKEGLTHQEIGDKCKVTEKTIDRDITSWANSGLFDLWLKEEFLALHPIMVKTYPEIVYKELGHLIGRMMARKVEVKEEITQTHNVNINVKSMLAEYECLLTETGTQTQPILGNSPNESIYSTQANDKASTIPIT